MIKIRVCGLDDDYTEKVQVIDEWLDEHDIEYDGSEVKEWYGDYTAYDTIYEIESEDNVLYQTIRKAFENMDVQIEI